MNEIAKPRRTVGVLLALLADVLCVLVFAIIGKATHEPHRSDWVVLIIWLPYLVAVLVVHDWLWRRGTDIRKIWPGGIIALVFTYVVGMALRALTGRGLAVGFLIVAAIFLIVTMIGWRWAWSALRRRRSASA